MSHVPNATPTVVELLEHERRYPAGHPRRASEIRKTFGIHEIHFEQKLIAALATTDALEHDANLTYRLTEQRARRTAARASRTFRR